MRYILIFIFCSFSGLSIAQFKIPKKPTATEQTSVYDYAGLLKPEERESLKSKLLRYGDSTSTQIVVAIIKSTNGDDISLVSTEWGQTWQIGQEKEDNGILILLATDDRRVDIATGYGIEYRLTDLMSERIINQRMIPQFKTGNFYAGLDQGTDGIFQALNGEFQETRNFKNNKIPWHIIIFLAFILITFIASAIKNKNNKNGGNRGGGSPSLLDILILSSMGRGSMGGFGNGGSSGGGFGGGGFGGGFGGGGFGGGGASGGW